MKNITAATPFMLIFRNTGPENFKHLSPDQRQQLITRWNEWYQNLLNQGKALEGHPLELETRVVTGSGGHRVTDGPYPESKEAIGGFVLLSVASFEEAVAIAQRHPQLEFGLSIEIRQMVGQCHLGVAASSRQQAAAAAV